MLKRYKTEYPQLILQVFEDFIKYISLAIVLSYEDLNISDDQDHGKMANIRLELGTQSIKSNVSVSVVSR